MTNKTTKRDSPLSSLSEAKASYYRTTHSSVLGQENAHLKDWRFSNGHPPDSNEAFFCGEDTGFSWAFRAGPELLEAFLSLYNAGTIRTDDYESLSLSPAHDYLRKQVTDGIKGWVCLSLDLVESFTQGFIEAVLQSMGLSIHPSPTCVDAPVEDQASRQILPN